MFRSDICVVVFLPITGCRYGLATVKLEILAIVLFKIEEKFVFQKGGREKKLLEWIYTK